jgi:hypothetical protein
MLHRWRAHYRVSGTKRKRDHGKPQAYIPTAYPTTTPAGLTGLNHHFLNSKHNDIAKHKRLS